MHKDSRIGAYVIALGGTPRNLQLPTTLKSSSDLRKSVTVMSAVTPGDIQDSQMKELRRDGMLFLGREISPVEVAVAMSHYNCYVDAISNEYEYALIFEDDMEILDSNDLSIALSCLSDGNSPTITTFFSPYWGIWKAKNDHIRAVIPPAYAAAYAINKEALQLATANLPIGLADWPIWQNFVVFEYLEIKSLGLHVSDSSIENSRKYAKESQTKFRSLMSFQNILKISFLQKYRQIVIYPLLWKLFLLWERRKGNRSHGDNRSIFIK
jgi:hypothetical protein